MHDRHSLCRARVPALAGDEVVRVGPRHAVLAPGTVVVGDGSATVGPEGVEVAVVRAGAGGCALAREDVRAIVELEGEGEGAGGSRDGDEEGVEADHRGG